MRKFACLCLALLLAFGGAAMAESVIGGADGPTSILLNWTPSADENRSVLVARLEEDDSYSYALIGAGDGEEALALFGGYSYAEQFAAFEDFAAMMQPAIVLEGNDAPLSIAVDADGLATVSAGEQMLAQFTDTPVFMIVTGSFAEGEMTMDENCDVQVLDENGVRVWSETAAVSGAYANICPNCGEPDDGSSRHHTLISEFCEEGHTLCMGDPEHYCDPADGGCGRYYECSHSNSHTRYIKCDNLWCYKEHGDHKELACGHRGCEVYGEEEKHAQCPACGGYLCDGKDHTLASCGKHHAGEAGDHTAATCGISGHYTCDGLDHSDAPCSIDGHYTCDGKDHSKAPCGIDGHYTCDGLDHSDAPCGIDGHYTCDGKDHSDAPCGIDGHYTCDGTDHSKCES